MTCLRVRVLALAISVIAPAANAESAGVPPWGRQASGLVAVTGETDLDDGGSFSSSRWFVEGGISRMYSRRQSFGVAVGVGQSFYDFRDDGISQTDLTLNEIQISVPLRFALGDTGTAFVIPSLSYAGEDGVTLDDGTTYGLLAGAAWRVSPSLSIGPGFGVFSSHGDDTDLFPILLIDWDITERLNFGTGSLLAATRGPGVSLSYRVTDAWTLGVMARYEAFEFRLDDDGDYPGAVGMDRNVPVILTASYTPNPVTSFTVFAGAATSGEIEFEDTDGNRLARDGYDSAAVFGLAFDIRF